MSPPWGPEDSTGEARGCARPLPTPATGASKVWRPPTRMVIAVVVVSVSAACGFEVDEKPRPLPERPVHDTSALPELPAGATTVRVFFIRSGVRDTLTPIERPVIGPLGPTAAFHALLDQPPTPTERAEDLVTAIPPTTRWRGEAHHRPDGVVVINVSNALWGIQGHSLQLAFGQLVCTVAPWGSGVIVEVEGHPVGVVDSDGRQVDGPLTCADYADLLPSAGPDQLTCHPATSPPTGNRRHIGGTRAETETAGQSPVSGRTSHGDRRLRQRR